MTDQMTTTCLHIALADNGAMVQIANRTAGEVYPIESDEFEVVTDRGSFSSKGKTPVRTGEGEYVFEAGFGRVRLQYAAKADQAWVKRRVVVEEIRGPVVLEKIVLGRTRFLPGEGTGPGPGEFVDYDTFWNAPTVAFLRWEKGGVFSGIENPFFRAGYEAGEFELAFEPSLILKAGEMYESEWQFIGVYRRSGVMIVDHNPLTSLGQLPRYRNPCGHVPIDRSEVRAMQAFALDYLDVKVDRYLFILYNFFYPLPQMPAPGSPEEALHIKMVDMFAELGGDMIIFNPMYPYTKPAGRAEAYWDLGPAGSAAQKIMDHARARGLKFGYYMGCARHGAEGNACALPYAPERPEWKKVDEQGHLAAENCIACDEYAEWFLSVQRNTIERFGLGLWSWDPGPGNGLFCHNADHGHLPGKGGYKGWRNATELMRRLKEACPGLYYQAFYGRKEHGLWGFKYFDQHESYWELGLMNCTRHSDLHADRMNADGVRHQGWWNQMFRFHPTLLTHGMVHRFQEGNYDPRLTKAWDHVGWRYSVMSCLAAAGSVTTVILPEDLSLVPEMPAFYHKWLSWARETFEYIRYNIPFGASVRPGGVDGWARIKGGHGFIFLCNPGPRPARIEFGLDDEIGLSAAGRFSLSPLYPLEGPRLTDAAHPDGVFSAGDRVQAVVPAYEVVLLELAAHTGAALPALKTPAPGAARALPRLLDDWRTADGRSFAFPNHPAAEKLSLVAQFQAELGIRELLARAVPKNLAEFEPLLAQWNKDYSIDNFAWSRPDRLWLVLPFVDAEQADATALRVNGKAVTLACHHFVRKVIYYADVTDAVAWGQSNTVELEFARLGAGQFLGPYLDYPLDAAAVGAVPAAGAVVYDRPLDAETLPGRRQGAGDTRRAPVVSFAQMVPAYLREGQETSFSVVVDMPPEELEGVFISAPVYDARMGYDAATGRWEWHWTPWPRSALIMDVPAYSVWAVAKNGLVSEPVSIPLTWRF
ncbi:MAG: hypothetical protein NTV86_04120 [Planctomycetota bacterium]|nr:hypothetical protein [Planctomycetota bacterium]